MPSLTVGQLAALGAAIVAASFGLNAFLLRTIMRYFAERFDRFEESFNEAIHGKRGLLVRVAVLEERRDGSPGRRVTDFRDEEDHES